MHRKNRSFGHFDKLRQGAGVYSAATFDPNETCNEEYDLMLQTIENEEDEDDFSPVEMGILTLEKAKELGIEEEEPEE